MMIASSASGRRKPWFSAGAGAPVGAERAHHRRELVLEAAAGLAQRGDAGEHVRQVARVVGFARRRWRCTSRPAASVVLVHAPRGVYWKMPALPPPVSQPAMLPSPAPMSDEITAM